MVMRYLFLFLISVVSLSAEEIKVEAQIESLQQENRPLNGMVTIFHPKELEVSNLRMEGEPLKAILVKKTQIIPTDPYTLSIYRFERAPQPAGSYQLPPVEVDIGGKSYRSLWTSYQVVTAPKVAPLSLDPVLKLELEVEGNTPIYPGQRFQVVYRYRYQGSIQLTVEDLPLLTEANFIKIGEEEISNYEENGVSIREVRQQFQADEPGSFSFDPSIVEGVAYDQNNQRIEIRSEIPATTITVAILPHDKIPVTFRGAVGHFTIKSSLLTPPKITEGEKMTLIVDIVGTTKQLDQLSLPDIFCQPGFSGMFHENSVPTAKRIDKKTKRFTIQLRPLHTFIQEVPPISFAFYSPSKNSYVELFTKPIPVEIQPAPQRKEHPQLPIAGKKDDTTDWKQLLLDQPDQKIEPLAEVAGTRFDWSVGGWIFLMIPLLLLQPWWQKKISQLKINRWRKKSKQYLRECLDEKSNLDIAAQSAYKAITYHLVSEGTIKTVSISPEKMPEDESSLFLQQLLEQRYGKTQHFNLEQIKQELLKLIKRRRK